MVGLLFALALVDIWLCLSAGAQFLLTGGQTDWHLFERAARLIAAGHDPYAEAVSQTHLAFRWSPVAAWLFVPITIMPFAAWAALHVVALVGFRCLRLAVLIGSSWPFFLDVLDGGVMIFVALAAYWAWRRSSLGTLAFFAFALLIPRPLMVPLLVWLILKRPEWRYPFLAMALVHTMVILASGWTEAWIGRLLVSDLDIGNAFNIAPSRFLGALWIPIGFLLAAIFTWRGRLGLASVAASPYLLPPYLLMLVLENPQPPTPDPRADS